MAHKAVPLITLLSSPSEIVHPSTFAYNRLGLAGNHCYMGIPVRRSRS